MNIEDLISKMKRDLFKGMIKLQVKLFAIAFSTTILLLVGLFLTNLHTNKDLVMLLAFINGAYWGIVYYMPRQKQLMEDARNAFMNSVRDRALWEQEKRKKDE